MVAANTAGTLINTPLWQAGVEYTVIGQYTFPEAIETGDTFTFTNMLPANGVQVLEVTYSGPEGDTNAAPTGTFIIGDGTDTDGYVTSVVSAAGPNGKFQGFGDGALIGALTQASRNVVATYGGTIATAANSGTTTVKVRYMCTDAHR